MRVQKVTGDGQFLTVDHFITWYVELKAERIRVYGQALALQGGTVRLIW